MSNTIYLYLKTHNKTGLKYLGKTVRNPLLYHGSGKRWKRHLKKHGYDVTTEVLFETADKKLFKKVAKEYSINLNVVESNEFANLCPEEGQGGYTVYDETRNNKISNSSKGRKNTWTKKGLNKGFVCCINTTTGESLRVDKAEFEKNDDLVGVGMTHRGRRRKKYKPYKRINPIKRCPHCGKEGASNNMTRYHFDNCKYRNNR